MIAVPLCGRIRVHGRRLASLAIAWPSGDPSIGVLTITIARSAAEILKGRVALEMRCLDQLYVNAAYVPMLQKCAGVSYCRARGRALSAVLDETMPGELGKIVERFERNVDRLWRATDTGLKCDPKLGSTVKFVRLQGF